ncbi:hypothetical protein [Fimbriiglobus ruber]|uniref:Arylsulfatase n=1 Tax=Fimbriiglobus ruber TaxID=1908690 RepID=A0A225DGR9_9BACT|nr:hypothetical protein [Fimbriiglobus ruber]OWK40153.1 hypothetical protein FRUB_05072 [Fimbriiglobus ruber]
MIFDLEADPGERRTLASKYPETVKDLRQAVADWQATLPVAGKK